MFTSVRTGIIAEFFAKEQSSSHLFPVPREFEARNHARNRVDLTGLGIAAKAVLSVFVDFIDTSPYTSVIERVIRCAGSLVPNAVAGALLHRA